MLETESALSQSIFDALDLGIILLDADARIVGWNSWLVNASGWSKTEVSGRRLEDIFPSAIRPSLMSAISNALEFGAARLLTHSLHPRLLPLKTRSGEDVIHDISIQSILGKPHAKCLIQITDITVQAHKERVFRQRQNARYDAVVDTAIDAILTVDTRGAIQMANPAAARAFGYSSAELMGENISNLIADQSAWNATWTSILQGDSAPTHSEIPMRRKDGTLTYMEVSASRWFSDSRIFVTTILHDVSERRAAEEALRSLNQTLELRVEERTADRDRMWRLSTDVMLVAQLDGTITAINPAWTALFGWKETEVVGRNVSDFTLTEHHETLRSILASFRTAGSARLFEVSLNSREGEVREIEWSAVASNGLLHAVGRDVTAERKKARALEEAEEALRQAQKMEAIGQLTGGIAHDFNNLLTGIIGAMHALKRRIDAGRYDDTQRFMDAAVTSGNRAAALTHRLLAFARRQPLDPKPIDGNQLVLGIEDLLRRTVGEQIRIKMDLTPQLWPTFTDGNQLESALLNLVINARDAMPEGGRLTITTRNVVVGQAAHQQDDLGPGEYTVLSVGDTGTGIPPENLPKVFEPFFTTKPLGQGTGLGLSMIYGFAKQSRGGVRIETTLGQGTTVSLYLPRHAGVPLELTRDLGEPAPAGAGERVLLVEDDSSVRLLIADVLRELGYDCIEASDAHSALPVLESDEHLDLMISDVGLPGLNGRQLAESARKHRPGLKVLFVTGYADQAAGPKPFLEPGMEMVTKPFLPDALASKIHQMITR